ncbi:hypothetical protein [uncultured Tenacibaculum sp.]|uniref:hypothetical protein n=1 Tax=uncultured Tenacibaculum sp. TaxID=174713 RepID=UPI00260BCF9D|nr:hypothetical protein [uncultured Tenacibaculum sp.]
MKKFITFFSILLFIQISFGQEKAENRLIYSFLDKAIGNVNTKLSYGPVYKEKYIKKTKDNHNFFKTDLFKKGSVTYRNETFFNVFIKYDLVEDFIILKIEHQNQHVSIIPEKDFLSSFNIGTTSFVKLKNFGFVEKLEEQKQYGIYRKHYKVSKENNDGNYIHHTFQKKQDRYILHTKNNYYTVKSKRDFKKIYPEKKKIISKFFNQNKSLFKNDFSQFISKLMKTIQA